MTESRAALHRKQSPPEWCDEAGGRRELGFSVLGLGKLGAGELNYSSDVDLVYIFEAPPGEEPGRLEGSEPTLYFDRLAREFGRLVSESRVEGFLYRVDLDLRPNGSQSPLVVTHEALIDYYELWADTWEKAAFMKARPVAGDHDLGWRTIRRTDPAVYQSSMNLRAVDGIRSLKNKISSVRGSDAEAFNVKIDPGGIRDVEFIAQLLQLVHGGRIPQLRDRSTQGALHNLAAVGLLDEETAKRLFDAYLFLRRTENRLQMEAERQVHRLPSGAADLTRLARAMGYLGENAAEDFRETLDQHRRYLVGLVATSFSPGNRERILELFTRSVPALFAMEASRRMVEGLVDRFAAAVDACADSDRALNNLDRFIRAIGQRRLYYELLLDRPELVGRLTGLFAASNYLSTYLSRYPALIAPLFDDPDTLLLDRRALLRDFDRVQAEFRETQGDSLETQLDALRVFHHKQVVNVGLLDLAGKTSRADTEGALTEIAEVCVEAALRISSEHLAVLGSGVPEAARDGAFLVIGMGKLASRELNYGSDLDLIFLYESSREDTVAELEAQTYFVRLAQRFISALETPTAQGRCYEVDARLRPSGNQGMLVCSIRSYIQYHQETTETWERQALLRARAVGGSFWLADRFEEVRRGVLEGPLPENLAHEIHHVRTRMEAELARETSGRRDFKTGRGGTLDVECAVQYLQLEHGGAHAQLFDVETIASHLSRLTALDLLAPDSAELLRKAWDFLQRLGSRLRVVENRSISDLDEERGDLDTLARQLGYTDTGREGGPERSLMSDYQRHTEGVRRLYLELLGVNRGE
jgi:glutamate-ammonia-ligase adenylyltransferase